MAGWIADYRKEIESDVWMMPPMYHRIWQYLKYKVNHSPARIPNKDGSFITIMPGQHATSYRTIAKGVGYYEGLKWREPNAKTVKVILDWMVKNNMIKIEGNTNGTIITIEKWELYQSNSNQGNTENSVLIEKGLQGNSEWITGNVEISDFNDEKESQGNENETLRKHLLDTNNNELTMINNDCKDMGKKRKRFIPPTLEEVKAYCLERKNSVDPERFVDFYGSKNWMVGKNKMVDWQASVRTWERNDQKNVPKDQPKKTGFHIPDEYSNKKKYSNDELEAILMKRKRGS